MTPYFDSNATDVNDVTEVRVTGSTGNTGEVEATTFSILDTTKTVITRAVIAGKSNQSTNYVNVAVDDLGRIVTAEFSSQGVDFAFGQVATSGATLAAVQKTTYTEQTTNAQRSIASASANDTAAGTGARTVRIDYYDQTGAGPFSETLTLNGTTGVNTVNTNICFIEEIFVITAGSTGSNVGIITLYAAINKGGAVVGTIAATDNQTIWAHHYVATGKTCNVTGISGGNDQTNTNSGLLTLRTFPIGVTNAVEIQVSDFLKIFGQTSSFLRTYNSPIKVTGPARIILYVTPFAGAGQNYYGSFDFFEA